MDDLTAVIVIGGTRTAYIVEHDIVDGKITDYKHYADYGLAKYKQIITYFLELGGKNLILPLLSWQSFVDRGERYASMMSNFVKVLTTNDMNDFFIEHQIQPHFAGLEPLLKLSSDNVLHEVAMHLQAYEEDYSIDVIRHHVVWEIAPMPTLTIAQNQMPNLTGLGLSEMHETLYKHYSRIAYGVELPIPKFYIGSARNGDIKLRTMYPPALAAGADTRFYFLKYPSLLLTKDALRHVMNDVQQTSTNNDYDYSASMNAARLANMKQYFESEMNNLGAIIGLSK